MKKKLYLYAILGFLGIWVILYAVLFGSLQWSAYRDSSFLEMSEAELQEGLKDFEIQDNKYISLSDDAWIQVSLNQPIKVKAITVACSSVKCEDENGQIYYSSNDDITGDEYVAFTLKNGITIIDMPKGKMIKTLRLDLTSISENEMSIEGIRLELGNEKKWTYLVMGTFFSLAWGAYLLMRYGKEKMLKIVFQNQFLYQSLKTIDQIFALAWNDFTNRFSGSYLGIFWGIIQPVSTIFLFWFVFQVGFRSQSIEDVPFILWLAAGMIPWNYFYDSWFGGTGAFTAYSYIVKKVVFKVEYLPLVKVISSAILNVLFNVILLIIYIIYGRFPGIHLIDMIYFSICLMMLTLALSYITASLNVFIKDIGQFLGIVLQFLMWMTPMMWQYTMIPEKYSWFYKLNPLHYVINGYRESLINGNWFFTHWVQMLWFWGVTITLLFVGYKLMSRLKIHFADVL